MGRNRTEPYRTVTGPLPHRMGRNRTEPNRTVPYRYRTATAPHGTEPYLNERNRTGRNGTVPKGTEPNGTEPNQTERNRTKRNGAEPNRETRLREQQQQQQQQHKKTPACPAFAARLSSVFVSIHRENNIATRLLIQLHQQRQRIYFCLLACLVQRQQELPRFTLFPAQKNTRTKDQANRV